MTDVPAVGEELAGVRPLGDGARLKYQNAVHEASCVRCGPAGHPAFPGSDLSDGHKHARALRALGKAFLLTLWLAARDLHLNPDLQITIEVAGE